MKGDWEETGWLGPLVDPPPHQFLPDSGFVLFGTSQETLHNFLPKFLFDVAGRLGPLVDPSPTGQSRQKTRTHPSSQKENDAEGKGRQHVKIEGERQSGGFREAEERILIGARFEWPSSSWLEPLVDSSPWQGPRHRGCGCRTDNRRLEPLVDSRPVQTNSHHVTD